MHHIWYHAPCTDGLGAAYAAWSALGDGAHLRYTPVAYGKPLPVIEGEDEVTMLDFAPSRAEVLQLAQVAGRITIIDHHASAERALAGLEQEALTTEGACEIRITFNMEHSGAVLAWQHFRPQHPPPLLLQLIEDRDLWRCAHPSSKPLHYALSCIEDFRHLDDAATTPEYLRDLIASGKIILEYLQKEWTHQAKRAGLCTISWFDGLGPEGDSPLCVMGPCPSPWFSDVGHLLLEQYPEAQVAALYNDNVGGNYVRVSLRARKNGPDVSRLAAHMGGGGHPQAAGFRVTLGFPRAPAPAGEGT